MLKVVITGASGFLGSNLINKLKNNNDVMVYALSSKEIRSYDNILYFHKDIIDSVDCKKVLSNAIVVNCAFPRNSTGTDIADGLAYIQRLFIACKKYNAKAIINISSQSVYSQKRVYPANENTEVCLESSYAVGKYATELMLESICDGTDIKYTNLRMASLIGPKFDQRIVNRFIKQALDVGVLHVEKNNKKYSFLDIADAINGIIHVIFSTIPKWDKIYNVGKKDVVTLIEIAESIKLFYKNRFDKDIKVEVSEGLGELNSALESSKFCKEFSYVPSVTLYDSIDYISKFMCCIDN